MHAGFLKLGDWVFRLMIAYHLKALNLLILADYVFSAKRLPSTM